MKRILHKFKHDQRGFTLAETLITVVILLLVTMVVAMGIPVAQRAYDRVIDAANAQSLLSTTMIVLRDELGLATEIKVVDNEVTYISGNTRSVCKISPGDGSTDSKTGSIQLQQYVGDQYTVEDESGTKETKNAEPKPLVSSYAATKRLYTTYDSITYSDGVFKIKGLCVKKNDQVLANLGQTDTEDEFIIRTINPKEGNRNTDN